MSCTKNQVTGHIWLTECCLPTSALDCSLHVSHHISHILADCCCQSNPEDNKHLPSPPLPSSPSRPFLFPSLPFPFPLATYTMFHCPSLFLSLSFQMVKRTIHSLSGNQHFGGKSLASKQYLQEHKPPGKRMFFLWCFLSL